MLSSSVTRWCLSNVSYGTALREVERMFQAHAAATGNAHSWNVDQQVNRTTRVGIAASNQQYQCTVRIADVRATKLQVIIQMH